MEYCQGGELLQRMHGKENEYFSEEEARKVFQQIISALNYCHGRKICHRYTIIIYKQIFLKK